MKPEEIKHLKYALPVCLVRNNAEASTFDFLSIFTYFELTSNHDSIRPAVFNGLFTDYLYHGS